MSMDEFTFQLLTNNEHRVNWDTYIQHTALMQGLVGEQKEHAQQAFQFLRRPEVLGESFLVSARDNGHPLYGYFNNPAPWTRKWLTRFADALRELRGANGFPEHMQNQIKDASKFTERASVLELAYKFFNARSEIVFDPKVTVFKPRGFGKRLLPFEARPDLKISDAETGEEIFVEVSALGYSDLHNKSSRTYHAIFDVLVALLHKLIKFGESRSNRKIFGTCS